MKQKTQITENRNIPIWPIIIIGVIGILIALYFMTESIIDLNNYSNDLKKFPSICESIGMSYLNYTDICFIEKDGRSVKYKINKLNGKYSVDAVPIGVME